MEEKQKSLYSLCLSSLLYNPSFWEVSSDNWRQTSIRSVHIEIYQHLLATRIVSNTDSTPVKVIK